MNPAGGVQEQQLAGECMAWQAPWFGCAQRAGRQRGPQGKPANPAGSIGAKGNQGAGASKPISCSMMDLQATPLFMELAPLIGKRKVALPNNSHSLLEGLYFITFIFQGLFVSEHTQNIFWERCIVIQAGYCSLWRLGAGKSSGRNDPALGGHAVTAGTRW